MKIVRRWLATMECRLLSSAGLGAGWSLLSPCWRLKILTWLAVIHAVTCRSCAGHLSIGASRGVPLWHSRVPAGDITCELYCSNLISGKPVSQYALYSLIFSPLRSIINREQHKKYPYNQFSHNRQYTECSIVKACTSCINFKVGVSLGHGFVSLLVVLDSIPSKEKCFEAPLLAQHLP